MSMSVSWEVMIVLSCASTLRAASSATVLKGLGWKQIRAPAMVGYLPNTEKSVLHQCCCAAILNCVKPISILVGMIDKHYFHECFAVCFNVVIT